MTLPGIADRVPTLSMQTFEESVMAFRFRSRFLGTAALVAALATAPAVHAERWHGDYHHHGGGGAAGIVQGTTVLARGVSTGTTGGLANPVFATIELAVPIALRGVPLATAPATALAPAASGASSRASHAGSGAASASRKASSGAPTIRSTAPCR